MPGTLLTIWLVRPWHMNPAPTMPTRIGRSRSAHAFNAVSTIHILSSAALQLRRKVKALQPQEAVTPPPSPATFDASPRPRFRAAGGTLDPSVRSPRLQAAISARAADRRSEVRPP